MLVDALASVPFAEADSLCMGGQNEVDQLGDRLGLQCCELVVPLPDRPLQLDRSGQKRFALGRHVRVVLNGLQEEPRGVPRVVARAVRRVEQVRTEAMPHDAGVHEQGVARLREAARREQAAAEGDERVAAPVPHESCRKVRQPGAQGWHIAPADLLCSIPRQWRASSRGPELRRRDEQITQQRGGVAGVAVAPESVAPV
mmetsp:Transcript_73909/g.226031  ORF Transcript_73909/g.226031 Transcript_73909/m.226031 type:complete len:200 (-) Transcript_73909:93-692(-)